MLFSFVGSSFYLYSVNPGEIQHYTVFHLGLPCFKGFPKYKGLKCVWLQHYSNVKEVRDGFLSTSQANQSFPNCFCICIQ